MTDLLDTEAIEQELAALTGWSRGENTISRTWERKGFNGAVQVVNVVAFVANQLNHHPDITVHDYNKVTVTSMTHDAGGVTRHDLALARRINEVVG